MTSMVPFLWRFRRWWIFHLLFKCKGCKQSNGNENLVAVRQLGSHQNCRADKRPFTSSILAIPAGAACPLNWSLQRVCVLALRKRLLVRFCLYCGYCMTSFGGYTSPQKQDTPTHPLNRDLYSTLVNGHCWEMKTETAPVIHKGYIYSTSPPFYSCTFSFPTLLHNFCIFGCLQTIFFKRAFPWKAP